MTLRTRLSAFIRRWVKPTPSEAASVLSDQAKRLKVAREDMNKRLRSELDAGFVGGVKVR
ncbi:hypothetical protein [Caulobacter segnis]